MTKPIVSLNSIEKAYGSNRVLGPFSLDINEGEIVGIIGENGAGKSTLLKIIAGILRIDSGCISREILRRGELGYVPQEYALYSGLTGLENLRFFASAAGLHGKRLAIRTKHLIEQVNLVEKSDKPVSTYSGGMKRRLNLAAALVGDVKLLLLDEPTVGADEESVQLILGLLKKLKNRGCAVVLVSHHLDEIHQLADRIVLIENGSLRVIKEGNEL